MIHIFLSFSSPLDVNLLVQSTQGELDVGSDDHADNSKIEPTKAEAEATARGLQVPGCLFGLYFARKTSSTLSCRSQLKMSRKFSVKGFFGKILLNSIHLLYNI